jgi:tryptophan synthase alpha chain
LVPFNIILADLSGSRARRSRLRDPRRNPFDCRTEFGHLMPASLIVYFPLADPVVSTAFLDLYADAGVDIIEFGWPSRSPYHDGPDVRASMARAASGDPLAALVAARQRLARHSAPPKALVMTYAEPSHAALSNSAFFDGVDAVLVVAPPRDARRKAIETCARAAGAAISTFLPLPVASADVTAARLADGYVMLQSAPGLTGPRAALDPGNAARIAELRGERVRAPIVLGFGISNGGQARAALDLGADGVVVGSAALRAALKGRAELSALLDDLRNGLDD